MIVKIGFGYDAHRFTSGNHIIIGGEKITFTQGIDAHSDGDVLLHAICDALLGAAGLGDIGQHFPDDDPAFKDIESTVLVQQVMRKLENKNYNVGNMDCTIVLEKPKLAHHIPNMRINIGKFLNTSMQNINIKATTNEGMGCVGRGEGLAAFAVVTLLKQDPVQL